MINGILDLTRKGEFLEKLNLNDSEKTGLPKELVEWLLVSQKILLPQETFLASTQHSKSQIKKFISEVKNHFNIDSIVLKKEINNWIDSLSEKTASSNDIEKKAKEILKKLKVESSERYQFENSNRDTLLKSIFINSYQNSPVKINQTIESLSQEKGFLSARFKNVIQIQLPRTIGSILNTPLLKGAVYCATVALTIFTGYRAYAAVNHFVIARAIPYYINNTPLAVVKVINYIVDTGVFFYKKGEDLLIPLFLLWLGKRFLPKIPYVTRMIEQIPFTFISINPHKIFSSIFLTKACTLQNLC